jgi:hypothetical protein
MIRGEGVCADVGIESGWKDAAAFGCGWGAHGSCGGAFEGGRGLGREGRGEGEEGTGRVGGASVWFVFV